MNKTFHIHISKNSKPIIEIERFTVETGKINFLFGESGIGKSLISKAIYGLIDPEMLTVHINGTPYRDYCASQPVLEQQQGGFFVFQEPSSHLNPLQTLSEQIREGSLADINSETAILTRLWGNEAEKARRILPVYPKPYRPSGGEKQRMLLTMAFKKLSVFQQSPSQSHLFVFDEPTGSLDNHYRNLFLGLLMERYKETPFTAIFITHDYSIISEMEKQHSRFASHIVYRELIQKEGALQLRNFAPGQFLNWLSGEQRAEFASGEGKKVVLQLKSGYRVFGKQMQIRGTRRKSNEALVIRSGEMVYIKAASGVGKTTLAKIIMGLQNAKNLYMMLVGQEFTDQTPHEQWRRKVWGKRAGMVFQHADEALNLQANVRDIFKGLPTAQKISDTDIVNHLRTMFDMDVDGDFLDKRVGLLSGGQKQRINLLRTLMLKTDLLILDEPLNGLDFESIQRVIAAIKNRLREGAAILMISHNEDIIESIVPRERIYTMSTTTDNAP